MNQIWGQTQAGPIRFTPETQSPQSWGPAVAVFCGEGGWDECPWFSLNQPSCNTFCVPMSQVLSDTTSFNYYYLHVSDRGNWGKEWVENLSMITQLASWRVGIWTQTGFGSRECAFNHALVGPTFCCPSHTQFFASWIPWNTLVSYSIFVVASVSQSWILLPETKSNLAEKALRSFLTKIASTNPIWRILKSPSVCTVNVAALRCKRNVD